MKRVVLLIALALAMLSQGGYSQDAEQSPQANPNVRRVGEHLKCLCGCKATVTTCDMAQCHFSHPARKKIAQMVAAGASDDQILSSFAKENGLTVLLAPPKQGFYLVGWIMPFVALAAGLIFYFYFVKTRRAGTEATAAGSPHLDKYRQRIDRELEDIDA